MKKNLIRLSCLLLLAFASCKSCKKDVNPIDQLPPATQTGANTAGCLINGVAWIPNGNAWSGLKPITAVGGVQDQFIIIKFNLNSNSGGNGDYQEYVSLCINNYKTLGERALNFNTPPHPNTTGIRPKDYGRYIRRVVTESDYMTTTNVVGKVDLKTFDETTGKLSGTFEFDAIDPTTNKIISIKSGRFDIDNRKL